MPGPSHKDVMEAVRRLQAQLDAAAPALGAVMELPDRMTCPACGLGDLRVDVGHYPSGMWATIRTHIVPGSASATVCGGWRRHMTNRDGSRR